jgi:hypothetical protein
MKSILRRVLDEVGISKEEKEKIEEQAKLHLEKLLQGLLRMH